MEGIRADLVTSGWIGLGVIAVALLVAGARNKVVIFYDAADMGTSALAIVLPIVTIILVSYQPFVSPLFCRIWKWGILLSGYASGFYCLLLNFTNATRHNRSVLLGFFIGIFKIAFLILSFAVLYFQMGGRSDRKRTTDDVWLALVIVLCMVFLAKALINGDEVYKKKGWQSSQRNRHIWWFFN